MAATVMDNTFITTRFLLRSGVTCGMPTPKIPAAFSIGSKGNLLLYCGSGSSFAVLVVLIFCSILKFGRLEVQKTVQNGLASPACWDHLFRFGETIMKRLLEDIDGEKLDRVGLF